MQESIIHFGEQFRFNPSVLFAEKIRPWKRLIVVGMGGSHLSADLLRIFRPTYDLIVWKDYGLPQVSEAILKESLIILSSYSGNTEEVLDAGEEAYKKGLNVSAISLGGKLKEWALSKNIPHVDIPQTNIEPRIALGFSLLALATLIGDVSLVEELHSLENIIQPKNFEEEGRTLAEKLKGSVPLIYTSAFFGPLAYNWKIKCNETAKIPAFCNVFPELNHNEMAGFDSLIEGIPFRPVFILDELDSSRIQKRMEITKKIYEDRGLICLNLQTNGSSLYERVFNNLLLADWMTYYMAKEKNVEPGKVAIIEEFKQKIK